MIMDHGVEVAIISYAFIAPLPIYYRPLKFHFKNILLKLI